jgi:hypothetical protein
MENLCSREATENWIVGSQKHAPTRKAEDCQQINQRGLNRISKPAILNPKNETSNWKTLKLHISAPN